MNGWSLWALIAGLTLLSGFADAYGFTHAAEIWKGDRFQPGELARALAGFAIGITIYLFSLRFLMMFGIRSAELQTLFWFGITLIGVGLLSGSVFTWPRVDQMVALLVLSGISWLMVRTA